MTRSVYLCGLISPDHPESLEWRVIAAQRFRDNGWNPLVPRDMTHAKGDGIKTAMSAKSVVARDMKDILECDVILVNFDLFGATRQSYGTGMELGMALWLRKPTVAVAAEDNRTARKHPFITELVSAYFTEVLRAVDFICRYYGDEHVSEEGK